ncbi:TMAO reductase system periplasmic protein TorT [Oceaniserpentilla sp. 4NH20-0058]
MVVNFALIEEAKRLGVRMRINEAGGYDHIEIQREQVKQCMASGADGLILSATDASGLNDLIELYTQKGIPVIDLINGVTSKQITARAAVKYFDNAYLTGNYLKRRVAGLKKNVLWLPGPKGPSWSRSADDGFKQSIMNSSLTVVETLWGDTGKEKQSELILQALSYYKNIDYIVGTSVSSDAAVGIIKKMSLEKPIEVLSYYYDPTVHRNISRGYIVAGGSDQQATQAKIAVDMLVRSLEGKLKIKHAGARAIMVDKDSFSEFDSNTSIPPKGFRPVFSLRDWVK